jgi:hypothetical protein
MHPVAYRGQAKQIRRIFDPAVSVSAYERLLASLIRDAGVTERRSPDAQP